MPDTTTEVEFPDTGDLAQQVADYEAADPLTQAEILEQQKPED